MKKICNIKIIFIIIVVLNLQYINLPGLYMDAVNPDYVSVYIRNPTNVPMWGYTDNIISTIFLNKPYGYPILNSLYGMNYPAYILLFISYIFGNGIFTVRLLHILYSLGILFFCYFFMKKISDSEISALSCTFLLALNPSFLFSFRTQYYLQLFPHLFFIPGFLLMVNGIIEKEKRKIKIIFLASILMGVAASSYFIFVGYYGALFLVFLVICILKKENLRLVGNSILGFLLGYFPFLYAHFSILIQQGRDNYIKILKSLDTYGISNGQKNILDRLKNNIYQIGNLSGGNSISKLVTQREIGNEYRYCFNILFIFLFSISFLILFLKFKKYKHKVLENKKWLALILLDFIFIVHFIMGLIIGTSLDYQHYIMLLPIMHMIIFLTIYTIYKRLFIGTKISDIFYFMGISVIGVFSIIQIEIIYKNINETRGGGMYSGVINDVGNYLENITTDSDIIICPQWGYWMGISIITNGEKIIWNDTSPEIIIQKIKSTMRNGKYYVILDNNTNLELIDLILKETNGKIENIISFNDYGNILNTKILLIN